MEYVHMGVVLVLSGSLAGVLSIADTQLRHKESKARESLLLVAYLNPDVSEAAGTELSQSISKLDSEILETRYQSKEEALRAAQANPAWAKALMLMKGNPLPSTVSIRFSDAVWLTHADPAQLLKETVEIAEVRWDAALRDAFRYYATWRERIRWAYGGLIGVFVFWGGSLYWQKRGLRKQGLSG